MLLNNWSIKIIYKKERNFYKPSILSNGEYSMNYVTLSKYGNNILKFNLYNLIINISLKL